jgi:protein DEK
VEKESHHKQTPWTPNPRGIAHNKKTPNTVKKDRKQENPTSSQKSAVVKTSRRIKKHKELQILHQDSKDASARRKISYKKREMQEPVASSCEESTRKRKRGTGRKPSSRKKSQQESKSDCKEITPITEPRHIIHTISGNDPSPVVQPKIGDDTLVNTNECNEELSGIKGGVQQQPCASDDWTEDQDLTLRQAYFTARPSPHFWKKVSKMVLHILPFGFFSGLLISL